VSSANSLVLDVSDARILCQVSRNRLELEM